MPSNEKFERLSATLGSTGWHQDIVPELANKLKEDFDKLVAPKRDSSISDDYLRGRIAAWQYLLVAFNARLQEYAKAMNEESELTSEDDDPTPAGG